MAVKRRWIILSIFAVVIVVVAVFAVNLHFFSGTVVEKKPVYVGVTFCGNTAQEAQLLIDKVKGYTNLFVLQSGSLVSNDTAVFEIGDYAVSNGLHFAAYFNTPAINSGVGSWVGMVEERWGSMFAGLYYNDEPGGEMLDSYMELTVSIGNATAGGTSFTITKNADGKIQLQSANESYEFKPNGEITVYKSSNVAMYYFPDGSIIYDSGSDIFFLKNGTCQLYDPNTSSYIMVNDTSRIPQVESYEEALANLPDSEAAAKAFVDLHRGEIESLIEKRLPHRSFPIFTSDYAFYWYDYLIGYDAILAEFGWNNTVAQEIGLARGAANLQNKSWGAMITWKYTHPPYMASGDEIYDQMRSAYKAGADYLVVFNYAEDMESPYGILKPEHFDALKRFWNEVVQNPYVTNSEGKAEAAFVLPKNCGWSLRKPTDREWGFRAPSNEVQHAMNLIEAALARHGLRLDIIYNDPAYPYVGKYNQVYYWNQTDV